MTHRNGGIESLRSRQVAALQSVDRAIGAIVDALRRTDRLRDTLIVFVSDNGFMWGEHRLFGKQVPYEEAISVPFIVRYDELVAAPRTDENLVLNIDIAPTVAEIAGVDAPRVDGRSLVPLLTDAGAPGGRRS